MASVELRNVVLEAVHDDLGHQGTDRTLNFFLDSVFWVGVWKYVKEYCQICKRCEISNGMTRRPVMSSITAYYSLEILAIDFTTVEKSKNGLENIWVMTDIFTKYSVVLRQHWHPFAHPIRSRSKLRIRHNYRFMFVTWGK